MRVLKLSASSRRSLSLNVMRLPATIIIPVTKETIPSPPSWISMRMTILPKRLQWIAVFTTTSPVTQTEVVDVNRASINGVNYLLIVCGLNTALRISDILKLRWKDVYNESLLSFKSHIDVKEKKTGKKTTIFINDNLKEALASYLKEIFEKKENLCEVMEQFIFLGQKSENKPISRIQAFRIISSAAKKCLLSQKVSCHSLRKTFGYHAWKKGVSPALLTSIYNHSSYKITTRYLGIDQDDRDEVFCLVNL